MHPDVLAAATESTILQRNTLVLKVTLDLVSKLPKALREAQMRNAWRQISHVCDYESDQNVIIDVISTLMKAGAEINRKFKVGFANEYGSLLQFAIGENMVDVARYLIKKGAETRVPANEKTGTPLQDAIRCCDEIEFAYFLLEHGSDINAPAALDMGRTALQAAVVEGHKDLVKDLLDRGADVNAPPAHKHGVTALQAAAINDDIDIATLLLQRGAHVAAAAAPWKGRTAINGAAERGHLDMLQLLINHYDVFEDIKNVLQQAAVYAEGEEHFEVARWLRNYPNV
jgi:ankyrin repeat protein